MHCPVSKIWWTGEHEHGGEKVAGHFTSLSFDTLCQWHLEAINTIMELLTMMWEKRAEKEMQENIQKHWLLFYWLCLKGGDETAALACTRSQMNQNWRRVQFFNVFRAAGAYALTPEALIIVHREHRSVSKTLLFFFSCFTHVHPWFP